MARFVGVGFLLALFGFLFACLGPWWIGPVAVISTGVLVYAVGLAITGEWSCWRDMLRL